MRLVALATLALTAGLASAQLNGTRVEVEDNSAGFAGTGWRECGPQVAGFSGGIAGCSDVRGDTYTLAFTGTAVSWIGVKCSVCGIASVSIDGGASATVDTAGPGAPGSGLTSEVLFSVSGLDPAVRHTMVITVTGTMNSGGAFIVVDAFDVTGSTTGSAGAAPRSANLLFSSGFEGLTALNPPSGFWPTGAWQDIVGVDSTTGFAWPINVWGGKISFQMGAGAPITSSTLSDYMVNQIQTVTGHTGAPTKALYMEVKQRPHQWTQDTFMLLTPSEQGDLYISYWMKLQSDLVANMTPQNWRAIFEWKTGGDYRVIAYVHSAENGCGGFKPNGALFWRLQGDNEANGGLPYQRFWRMDNCSHAVPVGEWFKFEIFWHRSSGTDGRVWMAVNGKVIADHHGPNIGVRNASINRIMMPNLYSHAPAPQYQWVDDVEIWDGFPPATGNNPPYAPH